MRQGTEMEFLIFGAAMRFSQKITKKCKNPLQGGAKKGKKSKN